MADMEKQRMQAKALRGDGVSMQTHAGMKAAGVGPYEGAAPAPTASTATYNTGSAAPGQDDLEKRQRAASAAKVGLPPGRDYTDDEIRAATLRRPAPR
jgi:hypothetical protein